MENVDLPSVADLKRIRNLSQFEDKQLASLAGELQVQRAVKGECVIEFGCTDDYSLYLLDGALVATAQDQRQNRYEGGTTDELQPIAQIRPSIFRVVAEQPSRILKIPTNQLSSFALQIDASADSMDVVEIEQSEEENALTIQLFHDMMSGNLKLPSLPSVAQRVQQAFADDAADAASICTIIQSDPVITAKLIMIANSPLYRGQAQIESLQQATVRLGLETTRKQVMTYAVKELFRSKTSSMQAQMQKLWKHSQHVASLCRLMVGRLPGFDAEQAQLAGLIHDLGEVAILQYAQDNEALISQPKLLVQAVTKLRPQITGMLLNKWNFAAEFVTVGEECEQWFRNPGNEPDLCDLVLIAQYHALINTSERKQLPPVKSLPAFAKLGMEDLDFEQIMEFMSQSQEEIRAIESHLEAV